MNKKSMLTLAVSAVLIIGVIVLVIVGANYVLETSMKAETDAGAESTNGNEISETGSKQAAEDLIGEAVSREEVEKSVGKWNDFEMTSNGCERGVYAGRFYYDDFTIFSRTYDKGKTFSIVSINE